MPISQSIARSAACSHKGIILACVWLLCLALLPLHAKAQALSPTHHAASTPPKTIQTTQQQIVQKYSHLLDSLYRHYAALKGSRPLRPTDDIMPTDPYFTPLLCINALSEEALSHTIGSKSRNLTAEGPITLSPARAVRAQYASLIDIYTTTPWYVTHEETDTGTLDLEDALRESVKDTLSLTNRYTHERTDNPKEEKPLPLIPEGIGDDFGIVVRRPNFWKIKTNLSLQFTQNHVSENWYKGGESNNALLGAVTIHCDFNNQKKINFDNCLEMKLGFQSTRKDKEHKFLTNSDLLRMTNKFGLKAIKNWYYTLMLQSWTQFCRGYRANDPRVYSDFTSPFESLLTVGMDYKLSKKNFSINATLSPIALKFKYVARRDLATAFGLNPGRHNMWERGSNITANSTWTMFKNVTWTSRFYYFTDYDKTQIEWENTFDLKINTYLKVKFFVYPRFDDSAPVKGKHSYFQFNELLSLGFDMNF